MRLPTFLSSRVRRLPIGIQLALAFTLILSLTAALGGFSVLSLVQLNHASHELALKGLPSAKHLNAARAAALEMREFEMKHAAATDASYRAEYEEKGAAAQVVAASSIKAYAALVERADEHKLLGALQKNWAAYAGLNAKVLGLGREGKQRDAMDIGEGASQMAMVDLVGSLEQLQAFNFRVSDESALTAQAVFERGRAIAIGCVAAALLIGAALAFAITRGLLRSLGGEPGVAAEVARAVANGDLSTPIRLRRNDTESLMARLKEMQGGLARVVSTVRESSHTLATASDEIAQGNIDLSGRTEQQASTLQETAASMEELGSTVSQNADNAMKADGLARQASDVAGRGAQVVSRVVQTMKEINTSSRRIADITGVIDSIAFQTNILALNAAVEAARAGDQGRGFAVVASEVRSLAQRSAESAKQINKLIAESLGRVEQGSTLVDEAGTTMSEVTRSIQEVAQLMNQISTASAEQSSGVRQVGEAVTQMDQTTQQNAALVEQSAAAADSLRGQARKLVEAVSVFRLSAAAA